MNLLDKKERSVYLSEGCKCYVKIDGRNDVHRFLYAVYNKLGDFFEFNDGTRLPAHSCYSIQII